MKPPIRNLLCTRQKLVFKSIPTKKLHFLPHERLWAAIPTESLSALPSGRSNRKEANFPSLETRPRNALASISLGLPQARRKELESSLYRWHKAASAQGLQSAPASTEPRPCRTERPSPPLQKRAMDPRVIQECGGADWGRSSIGKLPNRVR